MVILDLRTGWVGIGEDICGEIEMLVKKYRRWKMNCGMWVPDFRLGIAIQCLHLLDELEPPAPLELGFKGSMPELSKR